MTTNTALVIGAVIAVGAGDCGELQGEVAGADAADTVVLVRAINRHTAQRRVSGILQIDGITRSRRTFWTHATNMA